jgi:hypothetical protein
MPHLFLDSGLTIDSRITFGDYFRVRLTDAKYKKTNLFGRDTISS